VLWESGFGFFINLEKWLWEGDNLDRMEGIGYSFRIRNKQPMEIDIGVPQLLDFVEIRSRTPQTTLFCMLLECLLIYYLVK